MGDAKTWVRAAVEFVRTSPGFVFWVVIAILASTLIMLAPDNGRGGADIALSQNGARVIWNSNSSKLYRWHIPGQERTFVLRRGPAGMILAQHAYWYSREIGGFSRYPDDHGWSLRRIAGTSVWSNHASATAIDINALNHPQGSYGTYSTYEVGLIQDRLELMRGTIRWGGNYRGTPDEMHWEINASPDQVKALAAWLRTTYYGKLLLAANPDR